MVRVSNTILAIFNGITLVLGLAIVGFGLYLFFGGNNTACEKGVVIPLLIAGAALAFISLLGLIGSWKKINFVLIIYLIVMFLFILAIIVFTLFTISITNVSFGKVVSKTKIADFPNWLSNHFVEGSNWKGIKDCLIQAKVCKSLGGHVDKKTTDFYKANFSPMQSGCCQPPTGCGFTFQNATFWVRPKTGPAVKDSDCTAWSNEQETLCYNCEACKAGFVDSIRKKWKQLAIFNACLLVLTIIVYSVGCCAKRNNKEDRKYTKYRGYP